MPSQQPYHVEWRENTCVLVIGVLKIGLIVNGVRHFCSQQPVFPHSFYSRLCDPTVVREFMLVFAPSLSLVHATRWFERVDAHLVPFAIPSSLKEQVRQSQWVARTAVMSRQNQTRAGRSSDHHFIPTFHKHQDYIYFLMQSKQNPYSYTLPIMQGCSELLQGLITNDCRWSFHLSDCLLSTWIKLFNKVGIFYPFCNF